ncbi:MAG: type II secretion system protein [Planctomycetes bacterium]|nr:type II secretion system protein [Planctomycetota bacterium]MCP4838026.1 type II secretion system protein [Planctomycetota bacterium]
MVRCGYSQVIRTAFTLIELLAVVAIIGVLGLATVASYQAIASDVRRAGAVEEVKNMLSVARQRAIEDARPTALVFRPVLTSSGVQQLEGVVAQYSGETLPWVPNPDLSDPGVSSKPRTSRFVPVDSGKPMQLAEGIGVAVPGHRLSNLSDYSNSPTTDPMAYDGDIQYLTPSQFSTKLPEVPGQMIGILFSGDGSVANFVHTADADWLWVDFNADGLQRYEGLDYCNRQDPPGFGGPDPCPPVEDGQAAVPWSPPSAGCYVGARYRLTDGVHIPAKDMWEDNEAERLPVCQQRLDDEPLVVTGSWLAIYDERDARKQLDPMEWLNSPTDVLRRKAVSTRSDALRGFIDANARQLHFNKFSGVPLEATNR